MATFGLLALTFGPCIAVCLWLLNQGKLTKEERERASLKSQNYTDRFFTMAEIPVNKRAERVKAFLAHQAKVRQYAKDHPDEFQ
jgi:ABC-type nitrate/sulfonate/bicarbonate transport system substrate-binding protein